jgi:hypothetical protein
MAFIISLYKILELVVIKELHMNKVVIALLLFLGVTAPCYTFSKENLSEKSHNSGNEKSILSRVVAQTDSAMSFMFETCAGKSIEYVEAGIRQCVDYKEETGKMNKCVYSFSIDGKSSKLCESWKVKPGDSVCCKLRMKCCL